MDFDSDNLSSTKNESEETERELFRKEISTISFENLQKLKSKIGEKEYEKIVFGTNSKKDSSLSFKRANKNRPREMSSKKKIKLKNVLSESKPQTPRDPRFDPLCGTFDDKEFKSNYKFIRDIRTKEKIQLQKECEKEEDPNRKKQIQLLVQRMDNQLKEQEKLDKKHKDNLQEKTKIKTKLMKGEKPIYKRKSEKRIEDLVNKYEELKKSNKLQKHLERRHKKLTNKERKKNMDMSL